MIWLTAIISGIIIMAGANDSTYSSLKLSFDPESTVSINGKSNVNTFVCTTNQLGGTVQIRYRQDLKHITDGKVDLLLEVKGFECGNVMMEHDMQHALKASEYPQIKFQVEGAHLEEPQDFSAGIGKGAANRINFTVNGTLTIAGASKEVKVAFSSWEKDGKYILRGIKKVNMTDFDIKPPSAMFGMIKAEDDITLTFDLILIPVN